MSLHTLSDVDRELIDDSPTLARLVRRGRLAPSRLAQLLAAGRSTRPPKEPEAWECCGSNCRPCVREIWKEEAKVWSECHPGGVSDDDGDEEDTVDEEGDEKERKEDEEEEKPRVAKVDEEEDKRGSSSGRETPRVEIELEKLDLEETEENKATG
ncbi:hypothetical protein NBRC10512v2_001150 [Rhodotorula toruloides]|uniref:RHTO0S02e02212g1_1 n=2 Tax=Rhodotorula toruloides TaxID=5286 RepID=A0A061AMC6_RHOTO|nr:uncharacterized protein RHTO_01271 [Rhodotorula toruloides NP11]EMS22056.1 hypothetical protein RHTO_01271 [Rhodotorula toruloides NP11]CDR36443.1 RHTO0S02e02212g1_1 [Rhodotorula toruloides]